MARLFREATECRTCVLPSGPASFCQVANIGVQEPQPKKKQKLPEVRFIGAKADLPY